MEGRQNGPAASSSSSAYALSSGASGLPAPEATPCGGSSDGRSISDTGGGGSGSGPPAVVMSLARMIVVVYRFWLTDLRSLRTFFKSALRAFMVAPCFAAPFFNCFSARF